MHTRCIVAIFTLVTIPLSLALVSVDAPLNAADCQPVPLAWEGGIEPWLLRILSASSPNPVITDLASSTGPPFTWVVNIEPGTGVILQVLDSTGDSGLSTPFTIQPGTSLNGHCPVGASSGGGPVSSGGALPAGTNSSSGGESGSTSTGDGGASDSSGSITGPDAGGADGTVSSLPSGGSEASNNTAVSQQPGGPLADPSSESVAAKSVSTSDNSLPTSSDPSASASTSSTTSTPSTGTQASTPTLSVSAPNSALGSSTFNSTTGSPTHPLSFSGPLGGGGGQGQTLPATTSISSDKSSSTDTGQSDAGSTSFSKKVVTGPMIGGIVAGVLCALVAAFCVIRRCRRRRLDEPDSLVYPFSATDSSEAAVPREMAGRSGYPASTFSSWGNHGDLADERALSPTTPVASTEGPPWEAQGTIESRYAATFTPRHTASSSSIDRNDPTAQRRFRGPIPKNMIVAFHARPDSPYSSAILGEQSNSAHASAGSSTQGFDEIRSQEMTSWRRMHDMMDGRPPVVVGYPPPYTSR